MVPNEFSCAFRWTPFLCQCERIGSSEGSDSEWFARRGLQWQHNFPRELRPVRRPAQAPASQVWTYSTKMRLRIVENVCQKYPILSSQVCRSLPRQYSKQLLLSEFQSTSSEGQVRTATACSFEASSVSIWIQQSQQRLIRESKKNACLEFSCVPKHYTTYCIEVG